MEIRTLDTSQWWRDGEFSLAVILILAYLAFVLLIGPAYMKKRPAYKLTGPLLIYNAMQVFISMYLILFCLREVLETGLLPRKCHMYIEDHWKLVYIGNRLYFFAKVSELLDTVFFVLRKKNNQISFLHVYHHTGMVVSYFPFKYHPSHVTTIIRLVNSAVHVVMYGYYTLTAMGPGVAKYLTWKKYITSLQLVQFIFFIIYSIAADLVSECPLSMAHTIYFVSNVALMTVLFGQFYRQSYLKGKSNGIVKVNSSSVKNN
ncbi:elongation of very long chain fatty acids protein 7-like [Leguminivora glycinivorella]|uniref:elongation of very long chain fatty acids protein 7-like n=1 Tax=Leguminivora glycinivorella TaxID=1035111 RepID=UPI00200F7960|nr:elongation of very long chain fatty acids protein 7-like [Leguminivora glycinivorella]